MADKSSIALIDIFQKYGAPVQIGLRADSGMVIAQSRACPVPININALFDLPFAMLIPRGFDVIKVGDDNITLDVKPYPDAQFNVRLNTDAYEGRVQGDFVTVHLRFYHKNHPPHEYGFQLSGNYVARQDRMGRVSNTLAYANLPVGSVKSDYKWDIGLYCDICADAINKFVEHYKIINNVNQQYLHYLPKITASGIFQFQFLFTLINGTKEHFPYCEDNGGMLGQVPPDDIEKLKVLLAEDELPSVIRTLDCQIRDSLDLQDWRKALIESAVMFECWIQPLIRKHYLELLGSKTKVDKKMSFKDEYGKNHPMPIGDILKTSIEEAFGFRFQDTQEYKNLTTNTITPRNKIVHGSYFPATKQTAHASYASACAAMDIIRPHVPA